MGVDLRLMPLLNKDYWASHDMMDLGRDYDLWEAIQRLPSEPIPEPLWCFLGRADDGDYKYGKAIQDPYGDTLKWTTAEALVSLKSKIEPQHWRTVAAWAYLEQMPKDWKIVLYWH